jgi:hypothetical protein
VLRGDVSHVFCCRHPTKITKANRKVFEVMDKDLKLLFFKIINTIDVGFVILVLAKIALSLV